jgi:hypothetical protein
MILLLSTLLAASTLAILGLSLYLNHRERLKWMTMFSLQHGIPLPSTVEVKRELVLPVVKKEKKRFSIPIPGADAFRRKVQ